MHITGNWIGRLGTFGLALLCFAATRAASAAADRDVAALIRRLEAPAATDKQTWDRARAAIELGKLGPRAAAAAPVLVRAMKDKSLNVQVYAAQALGQIGPVSDDVIPALIEAMKHRDDALRGRATKALTRIGRPAIPHLLLALRDRNVWLRSHAAEALGNMTPAPKEAADRLAENLTDEVECVRYSAARALGAMGPAAEEAVGELVALLEAVDKYKREWLAAAEAAGAIGPAAAAAAAALQEAAKHPYKQVRRAAVEALAEIGPAAKGSRPSGATGLAFERRLKLSGKQEAALRVWLAKQGGHVRPAALVGFLQTALHGGQHRTLDGALARGALLPVMPRADAAGDAPVRWGRAIYGVQLGLRLHRTAYGVADDFISYDVLIRNGSTRPQTVALPQGRWDAVLSTTIHPSHGDASRRRWPMGRTVCGPRPIVLKPGRIISVSHRERFSDYRLSCPRRLVLDATYRLSPHPRKDFTWTGVLTATAAFVVNDRGIFWGRGVRGLRAGLIVSRMQYGQDARVVTVVENRTKQPVAVAGDSWTFSTAGASAEVKCPRRGLPRLIAPGRYAVGRRTIPAETLTQWASQTRRAGGGKLRIRARFSGAQGSPGDLVAEAEVRMTAAPSGNTVKFTVMPPAAGLADRDIFRRDHPRAQEVPWPRRPYVILYEPLGKARDPGGVRYDRGSVGVFDRRGRAVYQRDAAHHSESAPYESLHRPVVVGVDGCVIAFRRLSYAPKITTSRIVLVGLAGAEAGQIELAHGLGSSYPGGYHCRTWLEDIDADGKVEICRYNRRAGLECLRWDAARGRWQWLDGLAGRRVEKRAAPVRWSVTAAYNEADRTIDLRLDTTSLVDKPLTLTVGSKPLVSGPATSVAGNSHAPQCVGLGGGGGTVSVQVGGKWGDVSWKVVPRGTSRREVTLAPGGTVSLWFKAELPPGVKMGEKFNLRLVGRARWRRFDVHYREQWTCPLGGENAWARQRRIDAEIKDLVGRGKSVALYDVQRKYSRFMSTRVRAWLLERFVAGDAKLLGVLKHDVADETGRLALSALKAKPTLNPELARDLLLLALTRLDREEYAAALAAAGGGRGRLDEALKLVLESAGPYVDRKTLAELLSAPPG